MATLSLLLTAVDKASPVLKKMGDTTKRIAGGLAVAGGIAAGAAIAFGIESGQALMRIEKLGAQTDAVIKSMGATSWTTKDQIVALSDRLEKLTSTESEAIQEGANLLLTFKNIRNEAGDGNDIFDRTTGLMVDMARAMGTDASGSAVQLGKALNDPIAGISALSRVGVTFTDDQKELIKTLVESGDVMGAQRIILDELQQQFGGSGAAYADTFAGKMDTLQHNIGAAGEAILAQLMPELEKLIEWINTDGLKELDKLVAWIVEDAIPNVGNFVDWVIKWKDELILLAGAIGVAIALQSALNVVTAANPWGLVIAALVGVVAWTGHVVTNIDSMSQGMLDAADTVLLGMVGMARGFNGLVEGLVNGLIDTINDFLDDVLNPMLGALGMSPLRIGSWTMDNSGLDDLASKLRRNLADSAVGSSSNSGDPTRRQSSTLRGGAIPSGAYSGRAMPRFADGGAVMSATIALIGEGREPEAVVPFSKLPQLIKDAGYGGDESPYGASGAPIVNVNFSADASWLRQFVNVEIEHADRDAVMTAKRGHQRR